jgi:hypothetical protein
MTNNIIHRNAACAGYPLYPNVAERAPWSFRMHLTDWPGILLLYRVESVFRGS